MNVPPNGIIETVSGRFVNLLEPTIDDIDTDDMAWGLSRMPRYAGHTINELLYSVGQHSIFVVETLQRAWNKDEDGIRTSLMTFIERQPGTIRAQMLEYWSQVNCPTVLLLAGLVHDGSEAWLLDLPTPLKNLPGIKEAYGKIEHQFMTLIWQKLGIPAEDHVLHHFVRWADSYTLTIEAYHLMRSRGKGWTKMMPVTLRGLQEFKLPQPSIDVYEEYKAWLEELTRL